MRRFHTLNVINETDTATLTKQPVTKSPTNMQTFFGARG